MSIYNFLCQQECWYFDKSCPSINHHHDCAAVFRGVRHRLADVCDLLCQS